MARCEGTGLPAANVTRAWVGDRLPVVGDCPACLSQVEITRNWTAKYHRASNHKTTATMPTQ